MADPWLAIREEWKQDCNQARDHPLMNIGHRWNDTNI